MKIDRFLIIECERRIQKVPIDQIVYFSYDNYCVRIFLKDNSPISCNKPLKYFEELLLNFGFFRASKNLLVNMYFVKEYIKAERKIRLYDDVYLTLSSKKVKDFTSVFRVLESI